ncbi:MAG: phosphatidylserine decarboxylase, partial [Pseudomonadota bacterium]
MNSLFAKAQAILPHHAITGLVNWFARIEAPWFKDLFIKSAKGLLNIELDDAQRRDLKDYRSFNDFFTRELRAESRPISQTPNVACPVDGRISAIGEIRKNT